MELWICCVCRLRNLMLAWLFLMIWLDTIKFLKCMMKRMVLIKTTPSALRIEKRLVQLVFKTCWFAWLVISYYTYMALIIPTKKKSCILLLFCLIKHWEVGALKFNYLNTRQSERRSECRKEQADIFDGRGPGWPSVILVRHFTLTAPAVWVTCNIIRNLFFSPNL